MAKAASIYYLEDGPGGQGRPKTVFVGASWDSKNDPDGPRKILSFSLRQGEKWVKLKSLEYEDGTVIDMEGKTLLYKPTQSDGGGGGAPF